VACPIVLILIHQFTSYLKAMVSRLSIVSAKENAHCCGLCVVRVLYVQCTIHFRFALRPLNTENNRRRGPSLKKFAPRSSRVELSVPRWSELFCFPPIRNRKKENQSKFFFSFPGYLKLMGEYLGERSALLHTGMGTVILLVARND